MAELVELACGATSLVARARLAEALETPFGPVPAGERVALKRLKALVGGEPRAREAFAWEARAALEVRHPQLVEGLAAGEDERGPWLLMRWVEGPTLREVQEREGPLAEARLRQIGAQLARALAALHARGLVHGDVKPENARLSPERGAVLLDLGFARPPQAPRGSPTATPSAAALVESALVNPGSLAYLAPERARAAASSAASDLFALGIVLFELSTARHPFARAGAAAQVSTAALLKRSLEQMDGSELLSDLIRARTVPPSRLVPTLSAFWDQVLYWALARDAARRPAAEEFARALEQGEQGEWWRARLTQGEVAAALGGDESQPLVGRASELERLEAWAARAFAQDSAPVAPQALWIRGAEGSGKSRLLRELSARLRTRYGALLTLSYPCPPHDEARPCAPLFGLLERYLGLAPGEEPRARELAQLERDLSPTLARALFEALSRGLEVELPAAVPTALGQWLANRSRSNALLLFLDDLQNADEATLGVLADLASADSGLRLMLVLGLTEGSALARPAAHRRLEQRLAARFEVHEILLGPLSEAELFQFVSKRFHHSAPLVRLASELWQRSRGNPGLVAEILRELHETGQVRPHASGQATLELLVAPEKLPLPGSLKAQAERRFRELGALERRWLQRLAVVGGRIQVPFLCAAFPSAHEAELERLLERFAAAGWLSSEGDRYRFSRPAVREAVYRSIEPKVRRRIHAQAARALAPQRTAPGPGEPSARGSLEDAFLRAFHLRAAGESAGLLRLLEPLLQALLRRGQPHRVLTLARWGLEALEGGKASRAERGRRLAFLEAAADAADRLGYRQEQRQWLDQLSEQELDPVRDAEALVRIYLLHGRYAFGTGQYGLARGMFRNAVQLCEERELSALLHSEALRRLASVQTHVGELSSARELAARALQRAELDPQRALAHMALALIDLLEDGYEEALRSVDEALRLLRRSRQWNLPGAFALAHLLRGRIYRVLGRHARALGASSHAVRLAHQAGERRLEMEANVRLGSLLLEAGRTQEAEATLREAQLVGREIEDRRGQALAGFWLGVLLWEEGDGEGELLLERVQDLALDLGLSRLEALARSVRSRILLERGDLSAAQEHSQRALELLAVRGAELADRIMVTLTRAQALEAAGERAVAEELRREMERRLRSVNGRIQDEGLRRAHRVACRALVEAVVSPKGHLFPRAAAQPALIDEPARADPGAEDSPL